MVFVLALVLGISWGLWVFLLHRVARYRIDRIGGAPPRMEFGHHVYAAELYSLEGQRLLPWLRAAAIVAPLSFLVLAIVLLRRVFV